MKILAIGILLLLACSKDSPNAPNGAKTKTYYPRDLGLEVLCRQDFADSFCRSREWDHAAGFTCVWVTKPEGVREYIDKCTCSE